MNDTLLTSDTTPPQTPVRYDALGWFFVFGGLIVSTVLRLLSDGIYMNDDATHYFIARDGWTSMTDLLHRWGRVGYTVPTSPVAYYFGFAGCRVLSAVQTALLSLLAWRTARRLLGPGVLASMAALFVWLQPLTFMLSLTTLTETTGALYMMLGIWLYLRGNHLWSCVAFSWLLLARDETMAMAPLIALAMLLDARRLADGSWQKAFTTGWLWVGALLLASGPALYILVSLPFDLPPDGDPLSIFTREYSAEYGTGPLYWMAARWSAQATPMIVALGLLGVGLVIGACRRHKPLTMEARETTGMWLLPTWTVGYFVLHSVLFNRGLFAHGGEARYMVPLTGLLAVQASIGLRALLRDRRGVCLSVFFALFLAAIWLQMLAHDYVWEATPGSARIVMVVLSAGVLPLVVVLIWRGRMPVRPVTITLLIVASLLLVMQCQFYFRPLRLDNPVDPMDKPVGDAALFVKADAERREQVLIGKHPLTALLLPETQLHWANLDAIAAWEAAPEGTIFFWDSKNCNWTDPKEQETNQLLRDTLESQGMVFARFTTPNWIPDDLCEVIIFEKLPAERHSAP